jgi:exosortase/archaeosortase family protein
LPLVAAPLGEYALDAALDAGVGSSPLDAFIRHVLVPPMTAALDVLGFDVAYQGQTVELGTPRGTLFLTVGLVCAGLQPGILFLGVLGLHAWREETSAEQGALLLGLGAIGVYLMNLVRLVVLAIVGHRWGGGALQTVHAHAGWVLFLVLVVAFWGLVLPLVDPEAGADEAEGARG